MFDTDLETIIIEAKRKIKVIDLLNSIYRGEEVPLRISTKKSFSKKFSDIYVYEYDKDSKMYLNNDGEEYYTDELITGHVSIFDDVYVIEEDDLRKVNYE